MAAGQLDQALCDIVRAKINLVQTPLHDEINDVDFTLAWQAFDAYLLFARFSADYKNGL